MIHTDCALTFSLYTSFYYSNFLLLPSLHLKRKPDGTLLADWNNLQTDGPIGGYDVAETGAYVLEAFKNADEWIGTAYLRLFERGTIADVNLLPRQGYACNI